MRNFWVAAALAVFLAVVPAPTVKAAPPILSKSQVEAAYLYNFTRFVEWPSTVFAGDQAPLVVGILGQDPFGPLLDSLVAGEKIHGRPLQVRRFARVQDVADCQVLFISISETDRVSQICAALQNRHILTVSDIPDFARRGGIIEFVQEADRIRFRIALNRARAESLEISAKLLRPAEVVSLRRQSVRLREQVGLSSADLPAPGLVTFLLPTLVEWALPSSKRLLSPPLIGGLP